MPSLTQSVSSVVCSQLTVHCRVVKDDQRDLAAPAHSLERNN